MNGRWLLAGLMALLNTLQCSTVDDSGSRDILDIVDIVCATDDPILRSHISGLVEMNRDSAIGKSDRSSVVATIGKDIYDNPQTWKLEEIAEPLYWALEAVSTVASLLDTGIRTSNTGSDSAVRATSVSLETNMLDNMNFVRSVVSVLARQLAFHTQKARNRALRNATVDATSENERHQLNDQSLHVIPFVSASIIEPDMLDSVSAIRTHDVADDPCQAACDELTESLPHAEQCDESSYSASGSGDAAFRGSYDCQNTMITRDTITRIGQHDIANADPARRMIRLDRDDDSSSSGVSFDVTITSDNVEDLCTNDEHKAFELLDCNTKEIAMPTQKANAPSLYARMRTKYFLRSPKDALIHPLLPESSKLYLRLFDCKYIDLCTSDYASAHREVFDAAKNGIFRHGDIWRRMSFGDLIDQSYEQFYKAIVSCGVQPYRVSSIMRSVRQFRTKSVFLSLFSIACMLLAERMWPKDAVLSQYATAAAVSKDIFDPTVYAEWLVWPDDGRIVSFRTLWTQIAAAAVVLAPASIRMFWNLRNIAASTNLPVIHPKTAIPKAAESAPAAMLCKLRAIYIHLISRKTEFNMRDFAKDAIMEAAHPFIKLAVSEKTKLSDAPFGCSSSLNASTLAAAVLALQNTRWTVVASPAWMRTVLLYVNEFNENRERSVSFIYNAVFGPKPVSLSNRLAASPSICRCLVRASSDFLIGYEIDQFLIYVAMRQVYNCISNHTGPFTSSIALLIALRGLSNYGYGERPECDGPTLFANIAVPKAVCALCFLIPNAEITFEAIAHIYQMLHTPIAATNSDEENMRVINSAGIKDPEAVRSIIRATKALNIGRDDALCAAHLLFVALNAFYISDGWDADKGRVLFLIQSMLCGKQIAKDVVDYISRSCNISKTVCLAIADLVLLAAVHAMPSVRSRDRCSNTRSPLAYAVHMHIYSIITSQHSGVDARIAIAQIRKMGYSQIVLNHLENIWVRPFNSVHVVTQIEFVTALSRALGYTDCLNVTVAYPVPDEALSHSIADSSS